jgi:hypothetical protein
VLKNVFQPSNEERSIPEQKIGPEGEGVRGAAWNRQHISALLESDAGRDQGAASGSRLYHHHGLAQAHDDPVAGRKLGCGRPAAGRQLRDHGSRLFDSSGQALVFAWIDDIDA